MRCPVSSPGRSGHQPGYVAAQGIALTLHTDRPGDAIPLAMTELSLGHLDLSGPSAGLSLLGQF